MKSADFLGLMTTIFGISLIGIASIVLLNYMRPGVDNTYLNVLILGFLATNIAPLLGAVKGYQNSDKIDTMHAEVALGVKQTNGMMQDLLVKTADNATLAERANPGNKIVKPKYPPVPPNPTA